MALTRRYTGTVSAVAGSVRMPWRRPRSGSRMSLRVNRYDCKVNKTKFVRLSEGIFVTRLRECVCVFLSVVGVLSQVFVAHLWTVIFGIEISLFLGLFFPWPISFVTSRCRFSARVNGKLRCFQKLWRTICWADYTSKCIINNTGRFLVTYLTSCGSGFEVTYFFPLDRSEKLKKFRKPDKRGVQNPRRPILYGSV
jgi:hypothetical protein